MARRWTDNEWDVLFAGYPPDAPHRPDRAACVALGRRLDRTAEAVRAMWDDAAQWQRGLASSAASQRLKDYLLAAPWSNTLLKDVIDASIWNPKT